MSVPILNDTVKLTQREALLMVERLRKIAAYVEDSEDCSDEARELALEMANSLSKELEKCPHRYTYRAQCSECRELDAKAQLETTRRIEELRWLIEARPEDVRLLKQEYKQLTGKNYRASNKGK